MKPHPLRGKEIQPALGMWIPVCGLEARKQRWMLHQGGKRYDEEK